MKIYRETTDDTVLSILHYKTGKVVCDVEPIEITEEEIHKIANQYVIIDSEGLPDEEVPYFTMEGAKAILSKIQGE